MAGPSTGEKASEATEAAPAEQPTQEDQPEAPVIEVYRFQLDPIQIIV